MKKTDTQTSSGAGEKGRNSPLPPHPPAPLRPTVRLSARVSKRQRGKEARQRMWRTMATGESFNKSDLAQSRGLVLRERQNSIFSDVWTAIAIIFIIIGLAAGRNMPMLALGIILLIIVAVSTAWKNLSLLGVTYERSFDRTHVFPGEPVEITLTIANDKLLPLTWLEFRDELPVAPDAETIFAQKASEITGRYTLRSTFSMHGRERARRTITIRFPTRGYYDLGPVTYESGDIFTLFTISQKYQQIDTLVVYPQIWPLAELGLPAKEPFGEIKVRRSLFTDPIKTQGIRDYQPQDRFRDVHWKATARRGNLQTKIYDPSTGMNLVVFLNVATMPKHWMGFEPDLLERAVSVAASVANYGAEQGWGVGVYANGSVPGSDQPLRVPPGRSTEQLNHILEALAAVTEFATGAIERMMFRESPHLPWAATIVLVTAVTTPGITASLLRLKEAGRRVVLISLADDPPPASLGAVLTYHIPAATAVFQGAAAQTVVQSAATAALNAIPTPQPVNGRPAENIEP
ncbi:MAG: DUF58 domain-containing protein [Chloroflexi bacterium]|nr:DUF58 domain-containing protein [Chloroflexota bacterium]